MTFLSLPRSRSAEDVDVASVVANPTEFREAACLSALHAKTWNNPVPSGPYLPLRNDREAVCYQVSVLEADNSGQGE